MAGGAGVEREVGAIVLPVDAATGEAIAFACAQRGLRVSVAELGCADPGAAEVALVDLRSDSAAFEHYLLALRGNGARRVVGFGSVPVGVDATQLDAWVSFEAGIEQLVAAVVGNERVHPPPSLLTSDDLELLTSREREVMRLLLAGLGTEAIGTHLGIAANTVRKHLQNVLDKLGVSSRVEAAAWALRAGLEPAAIAAEATR